MFFCLFLACSWRLRLAVVLYGTVAPAGKAASDCPANSAKLAARLAPLAKGELAALQVSSEPQARRAISLSSAKTAAS